MKNIVFNKKLIFCLLFLVFNFLFNFKIIAVQVHFIPVDKGDCELIIDKNKTVLIDCGEIGNGLKIANYLNSIGLKKIDYFIATHPHTDHIGGFVDLANSIIIKNVIEPYIPNRLVTPMHPVYSSFLNFIDQNNIKIYKAEMNQRLKLGDGTLNILGPVNPYKYNNLNDCSIVCKFNVGGFSFLFCGDCQEKAELDLIRSRQNLKSTVLKLNHHGGFYNSVDHEYSNTKEFLDVVDPKICIATATTRYPTRDQPRVSLLKRLKNEGRKVYRTDLDGPIIFKTDGNLLRILTKHENLCFYNKFNKKNVSNCYKKKPLYCF